MTLSPMGEAAVEYARLGWHVFPCHTPVEGGRCSCGIDDCGSVGKHPRTKNGLEDATKSIDKIRLWWTQWPDSNIGCRTGSNGSGIHVIDVDGEPGEDSLACLEIMESELPPTVESRTGRGRHLFYHCLRPLPNTAGKLGEHIDSRGDGGYVLLPESLHANGNHYEWKTDPFSTFPAVIPEWMKDKLDKPIPPVEFVLRDHTKKYDTEYTIHRYYRKWFASAVEKLSNCGEGERNHRLYALSVWSGSAVQAGLAEFAYVEDQVKAAASQCGLGQTEIDRSWASGYEDGWLVVPLPDPPEQDEKAKARPAPVIAPDGLVITSLEKVEKETVDFLWGNRLVQQGVNLLVGDGGLGKSAVALHIAHSVTNGVTLPDDDGQSQSGEVMLVTYEDPPSVVKMRAGVLGIDPAKLYIVEGRRDQDGYVSVFSQEDVPSLNARLDEFPEVRMLIIDPWARYLDEADNKEHVIRRALAPLERIAQQRDVTILLVAHINKNSDYSSAEYRIAGHSGFKNAARSALMIGKIDDEQLAITHVKHNWSPPAPAVTYTWDANRHWRDGQSPLSWGHVVDLNADELFTHHRVTNLEVVVAWLRRILLKHGAIPVNEVRADAKDEGFQERTVNKAAAELNVVTEPIVGTYESQWRLP